MWCLMRIWVVPLYQWDNVYWNIKAMDSLKPSTSSSCLRQTATSFSPGVNNKTLAKGAARSGFLILLRCKGTPSYGSSKALGVDWAYNKSFAYHACQSFGNRTYSLSQHLSRDRLGNSFACPMLIWNSSGQSVFRLTGLYVCAET